MLVPDNAAIWVNYVVLIASIAVGAFGGLIAAVYTRLGLFIVGGWIGASVGTLLFNIFIAPMVGTSSSAPY